jgi:hypothetical protein
MNGGTIVENTGHGVNNYNTEQNYTPKFEMRGGVIRGNTGHGVDNNNRFTMSGGVIAGNSDWGVSNSNADRPPATFIKEDGGVIYGSVAANGLKNNSGAVNDSNKGTSDNTLWENDPWPTTGTPSSP